MAIDKGTPAVAARVAVFKNAGQIFGCYAYPRILYYNSATGIITTITAIFTITPRRYVSTRRPLQASSR